MMQYFKPTGKKILGVIIFLLLFSFIGFFLTYVSNPTNFVLGQTLIPVGLPLPYFTLGGSQGISGINVVYLIIDIIIFYLITCVFAIAFRRRKENVPNSNSGGGNPSPTNQTQP